MDTIAQQKFISALRKSMSGDVLYDDYSLGMYATDASLYQIFPVAIILPKGEADLQTAIKLAAEFKVSILPRGGGTSLAGQTVGQSLVIDFSKYMTEIVACNPEEKWVTVQPGIARDDLNLYLKQYGLLFAPDPATSSRANIGGMTGNNSSGTKSILYGKTVDHIISMKVLLSDGTSLHLEEKTPEAYEAICNGSGREAEIYSAFRSLIFKHSDEVEKRFPKVMRRVGGYNFDEFTKTNHWNLSKLICGSEGTLGLITEITLNLEVIPKEKAICVVHFKHKPNAIQAVNTMVQYKPSAVEILDDVVLQMSRENLTTQRHTDWIDGFPASVQIAEFYGDTVEELVARAEAMVEDLQGQNLGYAYPIFTSKKEMHDVWTIRKKGLGLMLGRKGEKKALAFIEDAAIPLPVLPEYIEKVNAICDKYETEVAVYAHASVGVIHVRPFLDMKMGEDIERFKNIARETFELVKHYEGSWSGEHGDGLVRSPFNEDFFGTKLYEAFKDVKKLLDPLGLMNPGKIVEAPPMDHNLRYGASYQDEPLETVFHYRDDVSFEAAVHTCTGVGECRKKSGGTMCPSFKATSDEEHSTRGRANALRLAMSGQMQGSGLTDERLIEVLDLCLSCKACKSECPSNVDMAKLKSEVWQKKYDAGKISLREKMINKSTNLSKRFSGPLAPLINRVQSSVLFRSSLDRTAGIDKKRILPSYASTSLSKWYRKNYKTKNTNPIALFADTYINYHDTHIGIAAVQLLDQCGYKVELLDVGCCQRPRISNGFLRQAKNEGTKTALGIAEAMNKNIPVVVCEPSCTSALQADLPDLIDDVELAKKLAMHVKMIDVFLYEAVESGTLKGRFTSNFKSIQVHGHCHQEAIYGMKAIDTLYQKSGAAHKILDTGCCGMAGSFGYEKEHYEISKKVGEDRLFPAIEKMANDDTIVACGVSCRHQIEHFTNRKALHWVETVRFEPDDLT